MGSVLEELVVNEKGVFLKPEHGGLEVTAVPVSFPADARVDSLGNPHHYSQILDYVFREHPHEMRGFTKGSIHEHKVPIRYYACTIISPEPEPEQRYAEKR